MGVYARPLMPRTEGNTRSGCLRLCWRGVGEECLLQDMKRKQEQCMPMLRALDVMEARMDGIETSIRSLDQHLCKLEKSTEH